MASLFPLGSLSTSQLQKLTRVLWSWSICADCAGGKECQTADCAWPRSTILGHFVEFYKTLTASYESDPGLGQRAALTSHEDLFGIIAELKSNADTTRNALLEKLFPDRPARPDQERAVNIAVKILTMVNCSRSHYSGALLEYGISQMPWRDDVTFTDFITNCFPKTEHPSIDDIKQNMRATKLKKIARLTFEATDNLRDHLKLDKKRAVVEIFHQTAFLKEHLRLTQNEPTLPSISDSLKLGALPRPLALEALATIQKILFPLDDAKSKNLLRSLTSTQNFDTDILRPDFATIRNSHLVEDLNTIPYHYFGSRLAELYDEMLDPSPRGIEKWFQRKSGARYVMMAAIAGVFFAIFLGMVSLAVGGFQAWVGYQAWKHPVSPPSSTG